MNLLTNCKELSLELTHWESTGESLSMEVAKTFFDFFHKNQKKTKNVLCNIYGGTEMMDNIYDVFRNWEEVVIVQFNCLKAFFLYFYLVLFKFGILLLCQKFWKNDL
jgi:hypothetical protein